MRHVSRICGRYEAYDRVAGQAQIAERTQQLRENGNLSKKDQKENDAEKQQLIEGLQKSLR